MADGLVLKAATVAATEGKETVFGDTSTLHAAQPMMAFVKMWVADHLLSSKFTGNFSKHKDTVSDDRTNRAPEYIVDFSFVRIVSSGKFKITLFDPQWTELEIVLYCGAQNVKIQYGYVDGKQSPVYNAIMQKYTVTYTTIGSKITVEGVINGTAADLIPMTLDTGTTNPSNAVRAICEAQGWQIGNFDETMDVDLPNGDSFALIKDKPLSYVNLYIAPYAIRKSDGQSGFRLLLDHQTDPPTAHFLPLIAQSSRMEDITKTYIYAKGINSSVLSLSITANRLFTGMGDTGTGTSSETETIGEDGSTSTSASNVNDQTTIIGGESNLVDTNQTVVLSGGSLSTEMVSAAQRFASALQSLPPFQGTMTIIGDPEITLQSFVRVLVPTSKGDLHYTSGIYKVEGISESVQNGRYVTDLNIVRMGQDPITADNVNILRYKKMIT